MNCSDGMWHLYYRPDIYGYPFLRELNTLSGSVLCTDDLIGDMVLAVLLLICLLLVLKAFKV